MYQFYETFTCCILYLQRGSQPGISSSLFAPSLILVFTIYFYAYKVVINRKKNLYNKN